MCYTFCLPISSQLLIFFIIKLERADILLDVMVTCFFGWTIFSHVLCALFLLVSFVFVQPIPFFPSFWCSAGVYT